jgi:hypothetical protein
VITPIADTTANVWFPFFALSMSKSQTPDILSEEPTHVPPNLCTFHPASAPLGKVVTFSSGNVSVKARASAGTAREKTRRLFLFPPWFPFSLLFVASDDDFDDDAVPIFPRVFFRHDSDAVDDDADDDALIKRIIIIYIYTKSSVFLLSLSLIYLCVGIYLIGGKKENAEIWKTSRREEKIKLCQFSSRPRKRIFGGQLILLFTPTCNKEGVLKERCFF